MDKFVVRYTKPSRIEDEPRVEIDEMLDSNEEISSPHKSHPGTSTPSTDAAVPVCNTVRKSRAEIEGNSRSEDASELQLQKTAVSFTENLKTSCDRILPKTSTSSLAIPKQYKNWRKTYDWLNFDADKKGVICSICSEAVNKSLPIAWNSHSLASKTAFIDNGFHTWSNALASFSKHQSGELHVAALKLLNDAKKETIVEKLSAIKKKEMHENTTALRAIFTSVQYLARQGLSLRGHDDSSSNLHQLLILRSEDIPELKAWLLRSGCKWTSGTVINEILSLFASEIREAVSEDIKKAGIYGVLMDGASDLSKREQISVCVRSVDDSLKISENFMGFYGTPNTKSATLLGLLENFTKRQGMEFRDMRGQCYDGASNMSGEISGLQSLVRAIEARALFVHCSAHCLNLVVQDSLEDINTVKNVIGTVKEMINFINDSPKRVGQFEELKEDTHSPNLTAFCPHRWGLRVKSLKSIYHESNYKNSMVFFENRSVDPEVDAIASAKAMGFLRSLTSFEFYFIITIIIEVFEDIELLNSELQKKDLCVNESHALVEAVLLKIQRMRDENVFNRIWDDSIMNAAELEVDEPYLRRPRKVPKRLEPNSNSINHVFTDPKDYYRSLYYEVVDTTTTSLRSRFQSDTMELLNAFENFVTGQYDVDVKVITDFYNYTVDGEGNRILDFNFNGRKLVSERDVFLNALQNDVPFREKLEALKARKVEKRNSKSKSISTCYFREVDGVNEANEMLRRRRLRLRDVVGYLKERPELRTVLSEFTKLVRTILTVPGSSCSNERSFSTMRRLKTYLRSTMSQERLNDLTFCHIYKDILDSIPVQTLVNKFISKCERRQNIFGRMN